ncbi:MULTISPECIES: hypothetical protein [Delftia]|uniref:hypothetical protein n=1 Tax=Delftia TaxID=80865 RepID=UPI000F84CA73|nr:MULTISPECIES: hypothetical protein [Delftia]WEL95672.1 hypothetical protein PW274_16495 [Delftia tsuruhatensis]WQM80208.1 hypothetical protein RNT40_15925 [Delftia tsuruhatensis]
MQETINVDGVSYTVEYDIHDDGGEDLLVVHLPDGYPAETVLRGGIPLKPAIATHVRAYVLRHKKV